MEEDAIRLRVPPGELAWEDAVHGRISFKGEDIRDFVILRSDRSPLYNFAVSWMTSTCRSPTCSAATIISRIRPNRSPSIAHLAK